MNGNIKIGYFNAIDGASLTATGVSAQLPIDNVKTINRGQVFRSNTTQTITGVFSSTQEIGMTAIWCPKSEWGNSHFDVTFYNGATIVKSVTDANLSVFFNPVFATRFTMTVYAVIQVDISRIFMGRYFEPTKNLEFGFGMKYKDTSTSERTEDGSLYIQKKSKYRTLTFSLADITDIDRSGLVDMIEFLGVQNDCYVSVFSEGFEGSGTVRRDFEIIGILEDGAELVFTSANRWSQKLIVNEL